MRTQQHVIAFASFQLDLQAEQLWYGHREVVLPRKPFAVLRYLVENTGRLVSKAELLDAIWPQTYVSDVALLVCISELHKALGDDAKAPRIIQTVRGRGIRFIAEVQSPESKVQSQEENQKSKGKNRKFLPSTEHPAPNTSSGRQRH